MTRRYEPLQTRKAVTGTAAPGALVETTDGSLVVLPIEEWPYFKQGRYKAAENQILDARFCQYLQRLYTGLNRLVRVPVNDIKHNFALKTDRPDDVLLGRYFPEWAYCPTTRKFQPLSEWEKAWKSAGDTARGRPRNADNFNPPLTVVTSPNAVGPAKKYQQRLEQVRFVLVAANGEVADVPWAHWLLARRPARVPVQEAASRTQAIMLDFSQPLPAYDFLKYEVFDGGGDLSGIQLTAWRANQVLRDTDGRKYRATLNGLYSLRVSRRDLVAQGLLFGQKDRLVRAGDEHILFRPVVRTSNSMYYATTLDSLFIPTLLAQQSFDVVEIIKRGHGLGDSVVRIVSDVEDRTKIELKEKFVADFIEADFQFTKKIQGLSNQIYRQAEFDFITAGTPGEYKKDSSEQVELTFQEVAGLDLPGLTASYRLDQLKVISVQPSYTRLDPQATEQALTRDEYAPLNPDYPTTTQEGSKVHKQFISEEKTATTWLPAYESYGEGIFFQFDSAALQRWAATHAGQLTPRLAWLQANYDRLPRAAREPRLLTLAEVMVHTTAHLLMKELEFQCGYPVTSLKERLYTAPGSYGILLYTVAGSEGSYGGLVGLCDEEGLALRRIFVTALLRAQDCASDPICWDTSSHGQGVGGVNLATCASCTLVPETSCEEFNSFLDRQLVVDRQCGYFSSLIAEQ